MFTIPEYLSWTSHKVESFARTNPLANAKKVTGSWSCLFPGESKASGSVAKNKAMAGWSVVGVDYKERLLLKAPQGYLPDEHEGVFPVDLLHFGNILQYGPLHEQALLFICEKNTYLLINEKELLAPDFEKLYLKDDGFSVTQLTDKDAGLILLKKTASTSQKFLYLGTDITEARYHGSIRALNEQGELVRLPTAEKFIRDVQLQPDIDNAFYMMSFICSPESRSENSLGLADFKAGYNDSHLNSMYSRELLEFAFKHIKGLSLCLATPDSSQIFLPKDPSLPNQPDAVTPYSRYYAPKIQVKRVRKKFEVILTGLSQEMQPYVATSLDAAMTIVFNIMELNNLKLSGSYDKRLNKFHCGR